MKPLPATSAASECQLSRRVFVHNLVWMRWVGTAGLLAAVLAPPVRANLILLSETRSVAVAGTAGGPLSGEAHSYDMAQGSSGIGGAFSGNLSGVADATGGYHADSQASQSSVIGASEITASGHLQSASWVSPTVPSGLGVARATSVFDVSFRVTEDTSYNLALTLNLFHADMPPPSIDFGLGWLGGNEIVGLNDVLVGGGSYAGILAPGDYQLVLDATTGTVIDPLGDLALLNYQLDFADGPVQVPETGETFTLLGLGLAALAAAGGMYRRGGPLVNRLATGR
jgi:hypothetical protein